MCAETLARWARTDWPGAPRVFVDPQPEADAPAWGEVARVGRVGAAYGALLRAVLAEPGADGDWVLLLEDDVDFHPRLAAHVRAWRALEDERCGLASLFNPSLQPDGLPFSPPNTFGARPASFLGAQALLLRRGAIRRAVAGWDGLSGVTSQRLARLLGGTGPIWVHRPSLVQHVAPDSCWGARVQRALDFDPAWGPSP